MELVNWLSSIAWGPVGFILLMLVIALLSSLSGALKAHQIYQGVPDRESVDVSEHNIPPPQAAQVVVTALTRLGFQRLGEQQMEIPGENQPAVEWGFVDEMGITYAGVVLAGRMGALATLITMFADDAVLETSYPFGERFHTPSYHCQTVSKSLPAAYEHHIQQVDEMRQRHGLPRHIGGMKDWVVIARIYRGRYLQRKLRPLIVRRAVLPLAAILFSLSGVLCVTVAQFAFHLPLLLTLLVLGALLVPPVGIELWFLIRSRPRR